LLTPQGEEPFRAASWKLTFRAQRQKKGPCGNSFLLLLKQKLEERTNFIFVKLHDATA